MSPNTYLIFIKEAQPESNIPFFNWMTFSEYSYECVEAAATEACFVDCGSAFWTSVCICSAQREQKQSSFSSMKHLVPLTPAYFYTPLNSSIH
jgi:hypothetical protein